MIPEPLPADWASRGALAQLPGCNFAMAVGEEAW
jgi:hypothetical protein